LFRVDRFLEIEKNLQEYSDDIFMKKYNEKKRCIIEITREDIPENDSLSYLVVRNRVNNTADRKIDYEKQNSKIIHRLADPLDYADGHMSLVTIERYIEGISDEINGLCVFRYVLGKDIGKEDDELYFETKLPVLRKEQC
jgi:hypothetical protein